MRYCVVVERPEFRGPSLEGFSPIFPGIARWRAFAYSPCPRESRGSARRDGSRALLAVVTIDVEEFLALQEQIFLREIGPRK